jgi:exodeoxyribonuclease VII large subunit
MHNNPIFTVTELNQASKHLLESSFPSILVEGEISNLARPRSGHIYFSLKDEKSQIRCAMFRMHASKVNFALEDGAHVQLKARVSIYPDRGDYQLIVSNLELVGDGLLKKAYEQLIKKLAAEGLFQQQHKQAIPELPSKIGVITSPTGAAVRDILTVLKRRFPSIPVIIYPTKVQGVDAKNEIVNAINIANKHNSCDVLLLSRGGGSLEDLWPFNEEIVAKAIFESALPIVSGVGHEVDTTISDLVADLRAATPSAAAELVSPDREAILSAVYKHQQSFIFNINKHIEYLAQKVDWLSKRIKHPLEKIKHLKQQRLMLTEKLNNIIKVYLTDKRNRLNLLVKTLDTISPLATLSRGYSIVTKYKTKKIISDYQDIGENQKVEVNLHNGALICTVEQTMEK